MSHLILREINEDASHMRHHQSKLTLSKTNIKQFLKLFNIHTSHINDVEYLIVPTFIASQKKNYGDDLRRTAAQIIYSTKLTLKETSIGKFFKLLSKYTLDINMPNILLFLHMYAIAEETVLEKLLTKHALSKIARRKECSA